MLRLTVWAAIAISLIAAHPGSSVARAASIDLTDQRGRAFTYDSLRGTRVVVTFVSAHCSDACPIVEAQIARCVEMLRHSPLGIRFLTVTLDPERDSANDLRRLAKEFDANPDRWIFAGGDRRDVHRLMHAFGVRAERDARGYASQHSALVYVLDSQLRLTRTLLPSATLPSQLLEESTAP